MFETIVYTDLKVLANKRKTRGSAKVEKSRCFKLHWGQIWVTVREQETLF